MSTDPTGPSALVRRPVATAVVRVRPRWTSPAAAVPAREGDLQVTDR
ncbi:hypothetical protein SAMN05660690_2451 [Geodermatophilus telluris]|uniref:Uncharacterized protein n=1 Tax=Geodermatophilus telluris TaxID=1190417 RepID=A0A1G6P8J9_9ACTN|nr:hypothetical protein [Geodermatophilus telluris]SDC76328.1 hypothetical protein SAMN05660690_2451 [Geodermatophilus telluris]